MLSFIRVMSLLVAALMALGCLGVRNSIRELESDSGVMYSLSVKGARADAACEELASLKNRDAVEYPKGILEELKGAYAVNNDTAGRINVVGTELDTVFLSCDDNERYLRYDFYGDYTYFGNAFLDFRCPKEGLAKNTILYAHTTRTGEEAFRSLLNYREPEYYTAHPVIEYSTLYETYRFKIFAVIESTADRKEDNCYFDYIYPYMTDSNTVGYLNEISDRSLYYTGVTAEPTDRFLTLSTCCYDLGSLDSRLAVIARLMKDGEDDSVDPSLIKENPDWRRPSKWYSDRGIKNPYAGREQWTPRASDD